MQARFQQDELMCNARFLSQLDHSDNEAWQAWLVAFRQRFYAIYVVNFVTKKEKYLLIK